MTDTTDTQPTEAETEAVSAFNSIYQTVLLVERTKRQATESADSELDKARKAADAEVELAESAAKLAVAAIQTEQNNAVAAAKRTRDELVKAAERARDKTIEDAVQTALAEAGVEDPRG